MALMDSVEKYAAAMKAAEKYGNKYGDIDAANMAWHECKKAEREMADMLGNLRYLMQQFDSEMWNCPKCGHAESTADMDSAIWLREWLAKTPNTNMTGLAPAQGDQE